MTSLNGDGVNNVNEYPFNFGYTPSLYNEDNVIEEESSNFEDSQPVSEQSLDLDDQSEGYESSNAGGYPNNLYYGGDLYVPNRARDSNSLSEFESLENYARVDPGDYHEYHRNSSTALSGVEGFNVETNLFEGGVEIAELEAVETSGNFEEEDEDEVSLPTHENLVVGLIESHKRRGSMPSSSIGAGGRGPLSVGANERNMMTANQSMTSVSSQLVSAAGGPEEYDDRMSYLDDETSFQYRMRQDTLDAVSSASEDFYEEDLNDEHSLNQHAFPVLLQNYPENDNGINASQVNLHMDKNGVYSSPYAGAFEGAPQFSNESEIAKTWAGRQDRAKTLSPQPMDGDQPQNQFDVYEEYTNTSQQISTDFSHPFPNKSSSVNDPEKSESKSNSTIKSNYRAAPMSQAYSTDTEAPGINLYSKNMRQISTVYDPIYESGNFANETSSTAQIPTSNVGNGAKAVPTSAVKSTSNDVNAKKSRNLGGSSQPVGAKNSRNRQIADTRFDSYTPHNTIKASNSDGEFSVKEDATKGQLLTILQSERDANELLKQENYAYQQQINCLNVQLAGTRHTLDQLRVAGQVKLEISHPDTEGEKGKLVNPAKLPNKFQMPKIGRARVDDPRDSPHDNHKREAEASARLKLLQDEAERLRNALASYPKADFSVSTETSLKRIDEETTRLNGNCDEAFQEFGDNIDPQQRKMLELEVFQVRALLDQTAATRQELEDHKQKIEMDLLHQMRLNGNFGQNYHHANHVQDGFQPPEIGQSALRSNVNEARGDVAKMTQDFEILNPYEMKNQTNMNDAVSLHHQRNMGSSVPQINNSKMEQVEHFLQKQHGHCPGEVDDILNGQGYVNGSGAQPRQHLDEEQLEERISDIEEGIQDVRLEDLNEVYANNMFKPISMNDSIQTGSVNQRMQSSATTPVQSLRMANQNLRSSQHPKSIVDEDNFNTPTNEVAVKTTSPEKSIVKRKSSIPRLDPNYVANNLHLDESPRLASPNRRHTISAPEEKKTFKLGASGNQPKSSLERSSGKVVNTGSLLLSKNRPLAARLHNEDNDSGFVGSGPSHLENLTSENSYSSSRDQTAAHSHAVRRSKTSVGDKNMNRDESGTLYGKKVDRAGSMIVKSKLAQSAEKLTVNVSDRDSDGLDSLDLESPNSSVGSVKRRPTVIYNPNKPKSSSTLKPQTSSIGVEANVKSCSKMAQTGRDMSANNSPSFEEPRENGHHPVSFKYASPRISAFISYDSSSTEDNLPGNSAENLSRRATIGSRSYAPLFRRSEAPSNKSSTKPKTNSLASASKFSRSENALEKSRSNQAKIDEIEKEIMSLKKQLLEPVCRTPSTSANIVSSTPRRNSMPTRRESFSHGGSFDKGEDSGIARYSDRLYGSEEVSDVKPQLNTSKNRIINGGKVNSFNERHECNKNGSCRRTLTSNTDGSKRMPSKKNIQTSPIATSDSDEYVTHENKKKQISSRRTAAKGVGSDADSAYDGIYKEEPRRRSKVKTKPNIQNHGTQMTFENSNVGQVPPTSVPVGSSTFLSSPNQFHHSSVFGASNCAAAAVTSASVLAYLPVVGVWQPAATIQPVLAPAATAAIIPQPATNYQLLYNQPAVAMASVPLLGTNTSSIPSATKHVLETENANPIRFYYKTDSKFVDTGAATGAEQMMSRSAEALYRSDSRRKYNRNGHRLKSDTSRLLESLNNADMTARQLNKLSKHMESSVYSHLNAAHL